MRFHSRGAGATEPPDRPNVNWCGDLTDIPTEERMFYLASVLDLHSRRCVGFAMSDHHDAELAPGRGVHRDPVRWAPPGCRHNRVSAYCGARAAVVVARGVPGLLERRLPENALVKELREGVARLRAAVNQRLTRSTSAENCRYM
jgi:hypothetical protein